MFENQIILATAIRDFITQLFFCFSAAHITSAVPTGVALILGKDPFVKKVGMSSVRFDSLFSCSLVLVCQMFQ